MFSNNKSSKDNGKKRNTVNSFKTKKTTGTEHNNDIGYGLSGGNRRTLPELPKRNSRNSRNGRNDYGFPSYTYRSSYSNYGSRASYNRNSKNNNSYSENNRGSAGYGYSNEYSGNDKVKRNRYDGNGHNAEKKNVNKKQPGVLSAFVFIVMSLFSSVRGSRRSNAKIVKNKTVSAKRNSIALPIFIFFIVLCFIYIVGSSVNFLTKKIVNYDVLSYGTIDTPKSANAIIVRSEKVYNTDKAGVISYDVADNEKVKKGTVVCSIKDEAVVAQMQASLDDINEQIMKMQSERKDISVYSEDIKKYNSQMKNIIDENAIDYAYMRLGNIYELGNTVQKQLDTRNQYLLSENSGELKELVSQKKEQESKLNENISNMVAEESGVVSYYIDGLEDKITPENMSSVSKNTISDTVKAESSFKSSVKANSPAFKIVTSNVWYIVSYINKNYIEDWEKGETRSIYIKDVNGKQHKLDAYIQDMVVNNDSNEKFVIFKLTRDMADFLDVRNITIETESSERGFKIPNDAIVEETLMKIPTDYVDSDGNLIKVDNGNIKKVTVSVSGKDPDDSSYSYTPVQMGVVNVGDTIKSPEGDETFVISDVLNTKGIYVVNTGIAEFRTIDLTNSVSNSTHTILDPSYNTNIYVYDRVMTDPRNVEKEQMVYE